MVKNAIPMIKNTHLLGFVFTDDDANGAGFFGHDPLVITTLPSSDDLISSIII